MIRAQKLTVQEFRGIRDLTIDLGGASFAVCGPNGTGKSGIVDALEFALTGNISRLSGRGTGSVSLKEHGPHVDSRNRPDKARVVLTVSIPSLGKTVAIERSVKDPLAPRITPSDPHIRDVLSRVALHPEFALSRRELIRYVISAPGDRAKEVQALLQLDRVEDLRATLQKIANASHREVAPVEREKKQVQDQLLRALEISDIDSATVLKAVNARRALLGLAPITDLTPTSSLKDGLATAAASTSRGVPKVQAAADLKKLREVLGRITAAATASSCTNLIRRLTSLNADPSFAEGMEREAFLRSALRFVENEACPVCDTAWNSADLKALISRKLKRFEEIAQQREEVQRELAPITSLLDEFAGASLVGEQYGQNPALSVDINALSIFRSSTQLRSKQIQALVPLSNAIEALANLGTVPSEAETVVTALETAVSAIPEPTQQDAARDYLTVGQERLETYRAVSLRLAQAQKKAVTTKNISDTYGVVSTEVLKGIYKTVEKEFSELYRFINRDDEGNFAAQLTPSIGKLGFDVDFYGRGFFPPGAYHSEGHQDSMGVCLYLALMKYLQGDGFTFAVLDDVLMSIDAGHRREVCHLLKERFPNTQFILTTHDEIWLKHMSTIGLIAPRAFIHFRKWHVDRGPTEWDDRDVWTEIGEELSRNEVRAASALLRYYLEYISAELCDTLRVPVEYRGDHRFELGDLLPPAVSRFSNLLKEAKIAAQSWGHQGVVDSVEALESRFKTVSAKSNVENWQINPAVHYNEWANLQAADFSPVVAAYRELIITFHCSDAACGGTLYVLPKRGTRQELRCMCGSVNFNFNRKPAK